MGDDNQRISEAIKSYLAAGTKSLEAKEKLKAAAAELKAVLVGKNFHKCQEVQGFKTLLRPLIQKEGEDWNDIWTQAQRLVGTNITEEDIPLWNKRESIRTQVNKKAREIIREVLGISIARDAEPKVVQSAVGASSSSSSSELPIAERGVTVTRPQRVKRAVEPMNCAPEKKIQRKEYDGLVRVKDFKPIYPKVKTHQATVTKLQRLLNQAAVLLDELGKPHEEWYGDAMGATKVRFYALKPDYVQNLHFREHKFTLIDLTDDDVRPQQSNTADESAPAPDSA